VRDTGIGIPSDVIPKLFSAFVQANVGMARRYGGTGLGLAISKQLVELMGGQIEAHSAPGVGSEFVFRVPVRVGDTQVDLAMLEEPEMPSFNVLVVDDNDTNRTVIENMLNAWGMNVTQASNGREALDILMAHATQDADFDLALVDMNMPELDGLGLAEAVRTSGRYRNLKMVLLSSVSSPDDVRRAQDVGYQRFVPKPLRKAELRQAILGISAELGGVRKVKREFEPRRNQLRASTPSMPGIWMSMRTRSKRRSPSRRRPSRAELATRTSQPRRLSIWLQTSWLTGLSSMTSTALLMRGVSWCRSPPSSAEMPRMAWRSSALRSGLGTKRW